MAPQQKDDDGHHHQVVVLTMSQKETVSVKSEITNRQSNEKVLRHSKSIGAKKFLILKDLIIVSLGLFMNISATHGNYSVQGSINGQLGINALMAVSAGAIVSNLLVTTLVVDKLGLKWTLICSTLLRISFLAANFHSVWWLLYSGAALAGLATGPMFSAQTAYLTWLGKRYAEVSGQPSQLVIANFFGVFLSFQRCAHLAGNLVSSLIFQKSDESTANHTIIPSHDVVDEVCASRYCFENLNDVLNSAANLSINETMTVHRPSDHQINILFSIYVFLALMAPPLFIFLASEDKMESGDITKSTKTSTRKVLKKVLATFKHMVNVKAILLMPFSFFTGALVSFVITTFSLAFVNCVLGIESLGYVMIAYGAAGTLAAISIGVLMKCIGRRGCMALGATGTFIGLIIMLNWKPSGQSTVFLYVLAASFGASNSISVSQFTAFIAFLYRNYKSQSTAHASYQLWMMTGMTVWHFISVRLCVGIQIYIFAILFAISLFTLVIVDIISVREEKLNAEKNFNTKL